jgi:hypothetical protein
MGAVMPKRITISVLFMKRDNAVVAQGIEFDIAAQGPTLEAAKDAFTKTVVSWILLDLQHGKQPLQDVKPAPAEYRSIFERAHRLQEQSEFSVPSLYDVPPAYMISGAMNDLRIDI